MRTRLLLLAAAVTITALALDCRPAAAQDDDDTDYKHSHEYDYGPSRSYLGGELTFAEPQGEFADFVDEGWGGGLHYLLRLDRNGWFGLRADASLLNYGHE